MAISRLLMDTHRDLSTNEDLNGHGRYGRFSEKRIEYKTKIMHISLINSCYSIIYHVPSHDGSMGLECLAMLRLPEKIIQKCDAT